MNNELKLKNIHNIMEDDIGRISDGYHTFDELYFHRMILFSIICKIYHDKAWKSKMHEDGSMFYNYFIIGVDTPEGQYSYHYSLSYWDYFDGIIELEKAPKWDGHKSEDIRRLESLFRLNGGMTNEMQGV